LGRPQLVLERPALSIPAVGSWNAGFDVSGDNERFVFFRDLEAGADERQIVVVQNWFAEFGTHR
jgi:hypothetical protein